jgi:hypothetical protein
MKLGYWLSLFSGEAQHHFFDVIYRAALSEGGQVITKWVHPLLSHSQESDAKAGAGFAFAR